MSHIDIAGLSVDKNLYDLIKNEVAPGTDIDAGQFFTALADIVTTLAPKNSELLAKRDAMRAALNEWHLLCREENKAFSESSLIEHLKTIGYFVEDKGEIDVREQQEGPDIDPEIKTISGPQLVVPIQNARFATNATNARWVSLWDAWYGSNLWPDEGDTQKASPDGSAYNPSRGQKIIDKTDTLFEQIFPLAQGSHSDVIALSIQENNGTQQLLFALSDGAQTPLAKEEAFVGYATEGDALKTVLLKNNNLHIELHIDPSHPIGKHHHASIRDVVMEAAITTIQDFEDANAAVDAEDLIGTYRNWNALMQNTLTAEVKKEPGGVRRLHEDRHYTAPNGDSLTLPGRSLLFIRNVGLHMLTDAVTTEAGEPIPQGFLDAMLSALAVKHDIAKPADAQRNSRTGALYIVKPKLQGPEEVSATIELFEKVEDALNLTRGTMKIGIMDEEQRTTFTLKECIRAAKGRAVFINTGFLDRTGSLIEQHMEAGPFLPKAETKTTWLQAYEDNNVYAGLHTHLYQMGQIGKGMYPAPDDMNGMMETKHVHPEAGANCAWVPSPTMAAAHAVHYHLVDVSARQQTLLDAPAPALEDLVSIPLLNRELTAEEIQKELDNNAQSILGYVVRWVNQGIGCSKVPNIDNLPLMEDRATLRISSLHIANWLHHNIITREQVEETFTRMAATVDAQNADDPSYIPMAGDTEGPAFQASLELVFDAINRANGYTEPVLHKCRKVAKARQSDNTPLSAASAS